MNPLVIAALILTCLQPDPRSSSPQPPQGTTMSTETLRAQVRARTSDSIATAQKLGQDAVPVLNPLVKDPDRGVRLQAMRCFDAVGGPSAIDAGITGLTDPDEQVAARAAVLLHHHPPKGRGAELIAAFSKSDDSFVRAEIPKIAGRVPTEENLKVWLLLLPQEKDAQVKDGMMIGLARMGHQPSREWFQAKLAAANGPSALSWLEAAEYMDDLWIVPTLAQLLNNRSTVYTSAPDRQPLEIRVCDLAAYAILTITKAKVEFPVAKGRYNDVQLDAARNAAQSK